MGIYQRNLESFDEQPIIRNDMTGYNCMNCHSFCMGDPGQICHNCDCFKEQMSKFIDFSEGKALMVNNADWLLDLNYVDMLRDVGAHFSVNRMLTAECYKTAYGERLKLP